MKRGRKSTKRVRTFKRGGRALRPSGSNNQGNNILYNPNIIPINETNSLETNLDNLVNSIINEEGYELIKQDLSEMIYMDIFGIQKHKGYGLGRYQTFEEFEPHAHSIFRFYGDEDEYESLLRKIYQLYSFLTLISQNEDAEKLAEAHEYLQTIGFSD